MPEFDSSLEFRDIQGFPGYKAGNDGSIWSEWRPAGRGWKKSGVWHQLKLPLIAGYRRVSLGMNTNFMVHRIILLAFVGPLPEGMMTRHLNGNSSDNRLENLCYGTPQQNMDDRESHGRTPRGEGHARSKVNASIVREIRRRIKNGEQQRVVARSFGVSQGVVCDILAKRTWVHVEGE